MDTSADNSNLKSQYAAQITTDLERNTADHERLGSEIAALQQQLLVLENNRALLLGMRQSLGDAATGDVLPEDSDVTGSENGSSATRKSASLPATRKPKKKADTTSGKRKKAESGRSQSKRVRNASVPTLGGLIRDDLTQHGEPRSAAEITAALAQALPDREIKATVVRSTLEALVAKGQAHRTKQKRAVFYSATAPETAADTGESAEAAGV
ncbi:BlaI/MecI/CopY family transcriptional regulator [Streptomyces solisilvae]|uniref:BlaI/MecI/CopY family transcriptional regulator n=1 Tax=Streptomyces malaysiensis TaxID=92644 RepID=UPI00367F6735